MIDYKLKTLILFFAFVVSHAFCVEPGDTIILKKKLSHPGGGWILNPGIVTVFQLTARGEVIVRTTLPDDKGTRDFVIPKSAYVSTVPDYKGIKPGESSVFLKYKVGRVQDNWIAHPGLQKIKFVGSDGTLLMRFKSSDGVSRDYLFPRNSYFRLMEEYKGIKAGDSVLLMKKASDVTNKWEISAGANRIDYIRSDGALIYVSKGDDGTRREYVLPKNSYVPLVKEYQGIKLGDSVLLLERASSTQDNWGQNATTVKFQYIASDGTLIERSKDGDGKTRDYLYYPHNLRNFFTRGRYVPLVQDYKGVRPKSDVLLKKSIKSSDGKGTLVPGVVTIDNVGANGDLHVSEKGEDGKYQVFILPRGSYTGLNKSEAEMNDATSVPQTVNPKETAVAVPPLSQQRYYLEEKKREIPVVLIKKDGTDALVVDARHFKSALKLRNSLDIYRISSIQLKEASSPEIYERMLTYSSREENSIPGDFVEHVLLDKAFTQNRSGNSEETASQLYKLLGGTSCPESLGKLTVEALTK